MEKWIILTTMKQHQELEVVITHLLCCFQNQNKNENSPKTLSKEPTGSSQNQKSLDKILCQELIKIGHLGGRGKIPETFSGGDEIDSLWKKNEFVKQYRLQALAQYQDKSPIRMDLYSIFCSRKEPPWFIQTFYYYVCLYTNPPTPSDKVWCYIHDHDQFPGCAKAKELWKWSSLFTWKSVP